MPRQSKSRRHSFVAQLESMERRELLTGAPLAFQSGATFSNPTQLYYETDPSNPPANIGFTGSSTVMTSLDIYGKPIDFNNDGLSDVITYGSTYELTGFGDLTAETLTAANRGPSSNVLLSTGSGFKLVPGYNALTGVPKGKASYNSQMAAVLDINNDGYDDFIQVSFITNDADPFFYNPATGKFDQGQTTRLNNYNQRTYGTITMGDVNGDKFPDMLLPNYDYQVPGTVGNYVLSGYSVFLAKPESDGKWLGKFESDPVSTITLQSPVLQIQAATETNKDNEFLSTNNSGLLVDVTGDGLLDMIVPENTGFTVFPNSGNGQFAQGAGVFVASTTGYPAANLQAGDLNGDGKIDLVSSPNAPSTALWADNPTNPNKLIWSANTAPISIYLNTSTSTSSVSFNVNQYAGLGSGNDYNGALALADFNQDGILDLAFASANYQSTNVAVATGDGNGGFGNYILFTGYSNQVVKYYPNETRLISSIGVGDYNNDGQLDITTSAFPNFAGNDRDSQCNEGVVGAALNNTFTNPAVSPATLSVGKAGMPYSQQLGHTGGNPALPYNYALNAHSSALPPGLSLSPSGLISGTPQRSGNFEILVDITQPSGMRGSSFLNLSIEAGTPAAILPGILPNAVAGVTYFQPLANQAGPSTWTVTGGQLPPGLTLSPNGVISGTPTGIGQYPFQVTSTGSGFQSSITYNMIVQGAAAPIVTGLKRYGYHAQPTTLVASFSQTMDATSANNVANYVLVSAGADGRFGTRDDKNIPLAAATYNPNENTVTLSLVQKNIPLRQLYALSINGTPTSGLQNTGGVFLGGQGVGAPGTNFVQIFSGKILAGPNQLLKAGKNKVGAKA